MAEEKVVLYDAEGIVEYKTDIKGWVGKDGLFYGEREHGARYANSTHKKCDCGNTMRKGWSRCDSCRSVESRKKYFSLEHKKWDGKSPVCLWGSDQYFWEDDALFDYCEDNDMKPSELMLMVCVPIPIPEIRYETWEEYGTDDTGIDELQPELYTKVEKLNEYIRGLKPNFWMQGKYRTTVNL